ncbi:hypothetical protein Ddc_19508 [Ditylenchus destructor]|nr:hypothetical protein Ddc_19508 [Ditylenchus destructor]
MEKVTALFHGKFFGHGSISKMSFLDRSLATTCRIWLNTVGEMCLISNWIKLSLVAQPSRSPFGMRRPGHQRRGAGSKIAEYGTTRLAKCVSYRIG